MEHSSIPQGYAPLLSIYETQKAIGLLKRLFEDRLSGALRLHRVSAPLFVAASSGLNDDLNGVERPVAFDIRAVDDTAVVVHSLAKWKRLALKRYQFHPGEGLYTDMNAIRLISKETGRSTPFRSSLRPEEAETNRGADTRCRRRAPARRSSNRRLSRLMAFWVS